VVQEIIPGVYWLSLSRMASVYLIGTSGGLMLVDTGFRWQTGRILKAVQALKAQHGPLAHIVITHGHSDHIGGAALIRERTGAQIWMHPADAGALTSGEGDRYTFPDAPVLIRRLIPSRVRPASVDGDLADGEYLPFTIGERSSQCPPAWQVRHTPGHTAGQCCLYSPRGGILVLGDAAMRWFGRLPLPFRLVTVDMARHLESFRQLCQLEFETALFGHGPPILTGARAALSALIRD
jgi:glyoxylase-like metal-dependent hydrolase (beta-lactamase superfamily II)